MSISVELRKWNEPVYEPGTSMFDFNEQIVNYTKKKYVGFIYEDQKLLFAGSTNDEEMEKDNLEEVIKHAVALRHKLDPDGVHLEGRVRVTMVDEQNNVSLLHNYDYYSPIQLSKSEHPSLSSSQGMQYSEGNRAVIERQLAREKAEAEARALVEKTAKEAKEREVLEVKNLEQRNRIAEHNSIFTAEHMWKVLDENRVLDKSQPRDFFDYTKNHATRSSFISSHAMKTTGEYRAEMTTANPDNIADVQINMTNDIAYQAMKQTHKHQLHNTHAEDRPTTSAQIKFEEALFAFKEERSKGHNPDEEALLGKFVAYQEIAQNRKIEKFQELVMDATPKAQVAQKSAQHEKSASVEKAPTASPSIATGSLDKTKVKGNILAIRHAYH